jgi:eukaryotic-like serine/threonine-protein kinase
MHAQERADNKRESQGNDPVLESALPRQLERFRLLKRIARGGMGEVFLATVVGIEGAERPVVIKTVRRDHDTDSSFLARFLDEARIQSQLHHPGVAQILEAATDAAGKPYVAVEYVEGRNLSDVRGRAAQLGVRVGWAEALALAVNIGDALAHVHERKDADGRPLEIVHRDLSPQNVMVGYGGDTKLIDFGTARGENRRCHTISGVVFAKPGYVAPEVANNTPGGVPSDLYAFGVILWELASGRRFLVGEPAAHLAAVGAGKKTLPPIAQALGAPVELDRVIAKLTAVSIEERMSSAREATAELVKILKRAPSLADGDRSVRGRIASLMGRLYPSEPARSRAEFQALVRPTRAKKAGPPPLPQSSPPPPESHVAMLPGTRYRIERELGRGAAGVVYEGFHLDLGRKVALKVLHLSSAGQHARASFVAEARAVARVSHEGLVRLYEFGFTSEGRPFYAMELVDGETLEKRLDREGPLPVAEAVRIGIGACRAIEAAHAAGLVHRDVKPGNLMLTRDGGVKLLDFGIAKPESELSAPEDGDGALVVVGTPEYMAPEQARGSADARSDVYALGAALYEVVTGALPHEAASIAALIERKLAGAPGPASDVAPGQAIPKAFDRVLERALSPEPDARFQSASDLREALESVAEGRGARRALRRGLGVAALGAVTFAATAILGASLSAGGGASWSHHARLLEKSVASLLGAPAEKVAPRAESKPVVATAAVPSSPPAATAEPEMERAPNAPTEANEPAPAAPAAEPAAPAAEPAARALAEFEALEKDGRTLKALHAIRKAAVQFPNEPAVLRAHARAAQGSKAWGEARRAAAHWAMVDPSTEARLSLARLERATGNTARAISLLTQLQKEDPKSEEVRRLLALLPTDQTLALNR